MAEIVKSYIAKISTDSSGARRDLAASKNSFTEINQAVELTKTVFETLKGSVDITFAALERGGTINNVANAFDTLQAKAGLLANDSLKKLQDATLGMVDSFTLMQQANKAVSLGLDASQLDEMAAAATKLGAAVGRDATEAFNDLVVGVGRGSKLILDNLGIIIKEDDAYQSLAQSLGKTTKELTFQEKAYFEIARAANNLGDVQLDAAQAAKVMSAQWSNLVDGFSQGVTESDALSAALREMAEMFEANIGGAEQAGKALGDFVAQIIELANSVLPVAIDLLNDFARGLNVVASGLDFGRFSYDNFIGGIASSNKTIKENQQALATLAQEHARLGSQVKNFKDAGELGLAEDAQARLNSVEKGISNLVEEYKQLTGVTKTHAEAETGKAVPAAKALTDEQKKLADQIAKTKDNYDDFVRGIKLEGFEGAVDSAIDSLDKTKFDNALNVWKQALYQDTLDGLKEAYGAAVSLPELQGLADELTSIETQDKIAEQAAYTQEKMTEAYEASVDRWMTVFQAVVDGGLDFSNMEGRLIDMASNIAGVVADTVLPGAGALISELAPGMIRGTIETVESVSKGGKISSDSLTSLGMMGGVATLAPGLLYNSLFASAGNPERLAREDILGQLQEQYGMSFSGEGFDRNLFAGSGAGRQLTQGLALGIGGGSGKLSDDLAGIFGNAVGDVDNYNQAIIKTLSLFDDLGTSAEQQRDALKEAFLDGTVTLEDYGSALQGLNTLAQENLIGEGSVMDAIKIMAASIDTDPRQALKGLELALSEAAEIGITTMSGLGEYLSDKLGPEAKQTFDRIQAAGVSSFEDISDLSADQIFSIVNELRGMRGAFDETFGGMTEGAQAVEQASDTIKRNFQDIRQETDRLAQSLKGAVSGLKDIGSISGKDAAKVNMNSILGVSP